MPRLRPFTLAGLALAAVPLCAAPAGLVHHWNFDEGPDWHDSPFRATCSATQVFDSEGSAHASLKNMGPASWVSGVQFSGLAFNGSDQFLATATNLAETLGGTASLSFWLLTTQSGAASPAASPGVVGNASPGGLQWGSLDASGRIGLALDGAFAALSAQPVRDGFWHHVVLTRDSSSGLVQVFVDGDLSASGSGPKGVRATAFSSLGRIDNGACFRGRLDQVSVFKQVLSPAAVDILKTNHAPKSWDLSTDGVNHRPFTTPSVFSRAFDVERDPLAVRSWTQPAHGSVTHNGDGSFTFSPVAGYVGPDAFTVTIEDGRGGYHRSTMRLKLVAEPAGGARLPVTQFAGLAPIQAAGSDLSYQGMRVPRLFDMNRDGLTDLLVGAGGFVWLHLNNGTATSPAFSPGVKLTSGGAEIYAGTNSNSPIALADMTGDGVPDLVLADSTSKLRIYRNTARPGAPAVFATPFVLRRSDGRTDFVLPDKRFDLGDWNRDGKPDLIVGAYSGNVPLYLNVNTAAEPRFEEGSVLFGESYNAYPRLCDLGLSGKTDLVRGINWGDLKYWLNVPVRGLDGDQRLTITDTVGKPADVKNLTDGAIPDFADLNGDGRVDLVIGGHASDKVCLAFGTGQTPAQSIAEIEAIYNAHADNLGAALSANDNALLGRINAANLNLVAHLRDGTPGTRESVFKLLAAHIDKYPFLTYQELDTKRFHHVPSIVLQNWVLLSNLLPDTPRQRAVVADILGLTGLAREIHLENSLAIGDNAKSVPAAYATLRDMMRRHPREAFPDALITIDQVYGDQRGGFVWTPTSAKNTFGQSALGNANEWAGDLAAAIESVYGKGSASGDYYTFVMGHEVVHSLDNYLNTRANKDLRRRWGQRIVFAAGPDVAAGENGWFSQEATQARFRDKGLWKKETQTWDQAWNAYWAKGPGASFKSISSMRLDIRFFLGSPQESLATQANHHFAHGPGRLIGAYDRFRKGEAKGIEPMKANLTEAVDFIDFISAGLNRVNLVETKNVKGVVVWTDHFADLVRDDLGRITRITVDGRLFEFALAPSGLITHVRVTPDPFPKTK